MQFWAQPVTFSGYGVFITQSLVKLNLKLLWCSGLRPKHPTKWMRNELKTNFESKKCLFVKQVCRTRVCSQLTERSVETCLLKRNKRNGKVWGKFEKFWCKQFWEYEGIGLSIVLRGSMCFTPPWVDLKRCSGRMKGFWSGSGFCVVSHLRCAWMRRCEEGDVIRLFGLTNRTGAGVALDVWEKLWWFCCCETPWKLSRRETEGRRVENGREAGTESGHSWASVPQFEGFNLWLSFTDEIDFDEWIKRWVEVWANVLSGKWPGIAEGLCRLVCRVLVIVSEWSEVCVMWRMVMWLWRRPLKWRPLWLRPLWWMNASIWCVLKKSGIKCWSLKRKNVNRLVNKIAEDFRRKLWLELLNVRDVWNSSVSSVKTLFGFVVQSSTKFSIKKGLLGSAVQSWVIRDPWRTAPIVVMFRSAAQTSTKWMRNELKTNFESKNVYLWNKCVGQESVLNWLKGQLKRVFLKSNKRNGKVWGKFEKFWCKQFWEYEEIGLSIGLRGSMCFKTILFMFFNVTANWTRWF